MERCTRSSFSEAESLSCVEEIDEEYMNDCFSEEDSDEIDPWESVQIKKLRALINKITEIPDKTIVPSVLEFIKKNPEPNTKCTICLNVMEEGENVVSLKCGHVFCLKCMKKWIQQHHTCPVCRGQISS